jgi:hypothetical protein
VGWDLESSLGFLLCFRCFLWVSKGLDLVQFGSNGLDLVQCGFLRI